jgi:hypothetical protein
MQNTEDTKHVTINHVGARAAFVNEKCYHSKRSNAEKEETVRTAVHGFDKLGKSKQIAAGVARGDGQLHNVLLSRLRIGRHEELHTVSHS